MVDTAVYSGDIDTLAILFDPPPELDGKINMQPEIVEVLHAGLRYLGKPLCNGNPEDLKALNDLLVGAKPHWRTIDYPMIEPLVAGDVAVSHGWNGAAMRARLQKPTLKYAYPKEGVAGWMDNAVVLADAPNMENAKIWQNFIMDPENAALISDFAKYANGIMGSEKFLPAGIRDCAGNHDAGQCAGTDLPAALPAGSDGEVQSDLDQSAEVSGRA